MAQRLPNTPDCGIKDCTRAAYRGLLCRKHYTMVPLSRRLEMMSALFAAQSRVLARHHRRQLLAVRAALKDAD